MTTTKRIDEARDLLELLMLDQVVEDSFHARRGDPDEGAEPGQAVRFSIALTESEEFLTQFGFRYVDEDCTIASNYTAVWTAREPISVSGAAMADFLERVAYMSVYPFFREAVSTFATRLRVPVPTLGLVRQGTVDLQIDAAELDAYLTDKLIGVSM